MGVKEEGEIGGVSRRGTRRCSGNTSKATWPQPSSSAEEGRKRSAHERAHWWRNIIRPRLPVEEGKRRSGAQPSSRVANLASKRQRREHGGATCQRGGVLEVGDEGIKKRERKKKLTYVAPRVNVQSQFVVSSNQACNMDDSVLLNQTQIEPFYL